MSRFTILSNRHSAAISRGPAATCLSVALFVWLALCSSQSLAFGADGHRIIVSIAEKHLSKKTAAELTQISGGTALTENTTPTAFPDLSSADIILAPTFNGVIQEFIMWSEDIEDAGIEETSL